MDDREKVVRILELLEKIVGNLDWVQIRLESPKHCSDTITKIKKELIKEINRTRNNLSSCVCKQGYKDLISFVKKLGAKK